MNAEEPSTHELHGGGPGTSVTSLVHARRSAAVGVPGALSSGSLGAALHGAWPSLGACGLLQGGWHDLGRKDSHL